MIVTLFEITLQKRIGIHSHASSLDEATSRLPWGFYTTFATLSGGTRVFGLASHLKRLYEPAKEARLRPSVDEKVLCRHIAELARMNQPNESRIRLVLTKDSGKMYIAIQPFTPLPESIYREGVHVLTAEIARHDPRIKGTDFIAQSAEQRKLVRGDVFEILLTHNGEILEGMTSNFYAVRNDLIVTAQNGILLGVTRQVVLRLARRQGMDIEYRPPRVDEEYDEAFLTSSSRGVVPVVVIDNQPVGLGMVGEYSKRLIRSFRQVYAVKSEWLIPKENI